MTPPERLAHDAEGSATLHRAVTRPRLMWAASEPERATKAEEFQLMTDPGRPRTTSAARTLRTSVSALAVAALVASLLPLGIAGRSPDAGSDPSAAVVSPEPAQSPAAQASPVPALAPPPTQTPSATSDAAAPSPPGETRPAARARFPFAWVAPTKGGSTNLLTAGGIKTVKFRLGGARGLGVLAEGWPRSQRYDCRTGALVPNSQYKTRPFGAAGLRYDRASGVYVYSWQTREEWSRQCRVFQLRLTDGTTHVVRFRVLPFRFLYPTERQPATNRAAAGDLVRIRFRLPESTGKDIFRDSRQPRSARIDCGTGAVIGAWSRTQPHGRAGLTRSVAKGDYRYTWQTSASWAGTCRRFEMRLKDGTIQFVRFRFVVPNGPPTAVNDGGAGFATDEATPFTTGDVLANDSDPEGDPLSVGGLDTTGTAGTVSGNGDGTFDYDPDGRFESLGSGERATDRFRYTLTDGHGGSDTATVTVAIHGLNDAPVIADQTRSVSEAALDGDAVGAPVAFGDVDTNDGHTFAITAGNTGGAFAIDASTGQLRVADATELDADARPSYALTVQVTDDGTPARSDSATVTVQVTDVNHAPAISGGPFSIDENPANGDPVGTMAVTDADAGQSHTFSIQGGNPGGAFAIGASSGQITVADAADVDHETNGTFTLQVRVTDDGTPPLHDDSTVTITVGDVNEAPTVATATRSVSEDAANGADVGAPVTFTDPDAGQSHIFAINAGNTGGAFAIDPSTGQITVADATELDPGTTPSYALTVEVTDDGSPALSDSATITVNVTEVNDPPIVDPATFSLPEDSPNATVVGTVSFTDPDAGQSHTFVITGGNTGGAFAIGATSGQITVADSTQLDFETTPSYALTVEVTDDGTPVLSDTATVTVDVTNVNEAPMNTVPASYQAVPDASTPGDPNDSTAALTGITIADPDAGSADVQVALSVTSGTLQVRTDVTGGLTAGDISGNGSATVTVTASLAAIDATLGDATGLAYHIDDTPPGADTLTVATDDLGNTGSGGARSDTDQASVAFDALPVADDQSVTVDEDTLETITLRASDPGDDDLTFTIPASTANGGTLANQGPVDCTAVDDCTTTIDYTPAQDFDGSDSFTFTVSDLTWTSPVGTVSITVSGVNDAPTASNLSAAETYTEDTPLDLTDIVVGDVDDASLTVTLTLSNPAAGSLSTATSGAVTSTYVAGTGVWTASGAIANVNTLLAGVTFTPAADSSTSFTIATSVSDGVAAPATGTKAVTGVAVNDAPTASNLSAAETYTEDTPLDLTDIVVADVDDASLTVTLTLSNPAAGSLNTATSGAVTSTYVAGTGVWTASGAIANVNTLLAGVTFTPALNSNASFTIATSVSDGVAAPATGTKAVTGVAVNDAPTSTAPTTVSGTEDTSIAFTGGNGLAVADVDTSTLTATLTASNGTLTLSTLAGLSFTVGDGSADATMTFSGTQAALNTALATLTHAPTADFNGASSVTFSVSDGIAAPVVKVVSLTITAVADITDDAVTTDEDTPITFNAITGTNGATADSFENAGRAVTSVTQGTIGSVGFLADGSLTYTPNANANGSDSFTYTVTSGGVTETATVSVTVTPVNDAPVGQPFTHTTSSAIGLTINAATATGELKEGATDVDDAFGELTVELVGSPSPSTATVTLISATDGSFYVEPPGGLSGNGAVTFQYRVCDDNAGDPNQCGSASTVTLNVTGPDLWFIDDTDAAGCGVTCNGSRTKPLVGLNNATLVARGTGDRVFAFSGTYNHGFTFNSSEHLIGQASSGATFDSLLSVTVPSNGTLDTRPTLNGAAVTLQNIVTLQTGATLRGLNISSTTNTALTDPAGATTGVTVSQVGLTTTTGTALLLNDLAGTVDLTDLDKNGAGTGISLASVAAAVTIPSGATLQNTTVAAVDIDGGLGAFSYAGTISNNSGRTVEVTNRNTGSPGLVQFTGGVAATGGTGVNLDNNDNGTITFSGGLALSTGANPAFTAINGGTVTATQNNTTIVNTLTTTTGTALTVTNTAIGASDLTFRSISANGAANGIVLTATGSVGGLTVSGAGGSCASIATCTGGAIQSTTQSGALLISVSDVSLTNMIIQTSNEDGIEGSGITGLNLTGTVVTNNGDDSEDVGVGIDNLLGTSTWTNVSVTASELANVMIDNTSGTLTSWTVTGASHFDSLGTAFGGNSVLVNIRGTATMLNGNIDGATFQNNKPARGITVQAQDTGSIGDASSNAFTVQNSTFTNNGLQASFEQAHSANITFKLINNGTPGAPMTMPNTGVGTSHAVNVFSSSTTTGGAIRGRIAGNYIGDAASPGSGSAIGNGLRVFIQGRTQATLVIDGNVIRQTPTARGMDLQFVGQLTSGQPIIQHDVTVTNNNVVPSDTTGFPAAAIVVSADNQGSPARVRANVTGNTVPAGAAIDYTDDYLILANVAPGAELQLVDTSAPISGTCDAELAATNTGSTGTVPTCTLIAGPISTPP